MTPASLPTVFVSHGAPSFLLGDSPALRFLQGLGRSLGEPRAILCVSAHWETERPAVGGVEQPSTIHDFYGFPEALYEIRYPVPGTPALAERVRQLLQAADLTCDVDGTRGLDHGAWVPLRLMYPEATVAVTQLSLQTARGPAWHVALGRALSPLRREGVLVLGSGGAVHNLGAWRHNSQTIPDWAQRFDDWLAAAVNEGDSERLIDYRAATLDGAAAHPSEEHLLPLFVALGAAGDNAMGRVLHRSFLDGSLSMAAFAFE
jgi:4,5-DOPA dioxygenase extradiol